MKYIMGIVFVLIIGIGAVYAYNRIQSSKSAGSSLETQTIVMGDDEYTPSDVTIQKGQTVVFKNESVDWRWPASNLHPTHDIYPQFDPKEPVAPGDTWSFQFDQAGDWRMHDHLAPYITGTITVKE
jgi:plastocyanin